MSSEDRGPVRYEVIVGVQGPRTSEFEIDRAEWDAMTPAGRRALLDESAAEEVTNAGGWGYNLLDPDDEAAMVDPPPGEVDARWFNAEIMRQQQIIRDAEARIEQLGDEYKPVRR